MVAPILDDSWVTQGIEPMVMAGTTIHFGLVGAHTSQLGCAHLQVFPMLLLLVVACGLTLTIGCRHMTFHTSRKTWSQTSRLRVFITRHRVFIVRIDDVLWCFLWWRDYSKSLLPCIRLLCEKRPQDKSKTQRRWQISCKVLLVLQKIVQPELCCGIQTLCNPKSKCLLPHLRV